MGTGSINARGIWHNGGLAIPLPAGIVISPVLRVWIKAIWWIGMLPASPLSVGKAITLTIWC